MEVHNCSAIPITIAGLIVSCVLLCYVTSVGLGHLYYFLPLVSDISTFPPESCLFSLFMNPSAVMMAICMWIRNEQVAKHLTSGCSPIRSMLLTANRLNRWLPLSALVGYQLIIHFQEVNGVWLHVVATVVFFYSLGLYFVMDTFISYNTTLSTRRVAKVKLCLVTAFFILCSISGNSIMLMCLCFTGDNLTYVPLIKPEDGGYIFHTVASFFEWIIMLDFAAYLIMVSRDFKGLTIKLPEVCFVTTDSQTQSKEGESGTQESDTRPPDNSTTSTGMSMENQTTEKKYK